QLFDMTAGSDDNRGGECVQAIDAEYLCNAEAGYDGPTGNGTPNGAFAFTSLPPDVRTGGASGASKGQATLQGSINPQGAPTSYEFEYSTSSEYGAAAPSPQASAGSGTAAVGVQQTISGLQANTTYHYRLVATNAAGTSAGPDRRLRMAKPVIRAVQPG